MVLASTLTKMAQDMKESGKMINSMEKGSKLGQIKPLTKVCTLKGKSMELVSSLGRTVALIKDLLSTTTSRATAATNGLTVVCTKAAGKTTKCMEVDFSLGPTDVLMKGHTLTIRRKVLALLLGRTTANTLGLG